MEDAEVVGVTNSVILQSLKDRREVFKMISTEKWRNYLPRVGISYFGLKNNNLNQSDSQYNDVRLQINQLLYDGGENKLEIESATLQELINQEDWKITKDKLSLEIRKTYIKSLTNQVKLHLVKKTLERTLSQINDIKKENEAGFATELQRLEVESKIREIELLSLKTESNNNQTNIELRKILNLPLELPLRLKESLLRDYVLLPPYFKDDTSNVAVAKKPEIKKSQITIENLKTRKEITENYWKPKVFLGSYYGQNINGPLPVKNDVYGFSISFQTQLGSTTNQSTANYGMQTDGTGIQRIPGFGPQFVGRGENAFNSSTLNLFDDLSYSRKIYEGKIALSDAVRNNQLIEIALKAEAFKAREKVREAWQILRLTNSRFFITYETWKSMQAKAATGYSKKTEMISAELELLKSADDLAAAIGGYLESVMDLSFATGVDVSEWQFYLYKKGEGNSLLAQLYSDDSFLLNQNNRLLEERNPEQDGLNSDKKNPKRPDKSDYKFYLED
ncbi:TolC family protein [Leptospira sp. 'Mane']|uniref:TolC family protein n=1 Tax=Leptospira sp. 'Mane' TaxID=3387407 RepID=UPI00398B8D6B